MKKWWKKFWPSTKTTPLPKNPKQSENLEQVADVPIEDENPLSYLELVYPPEDEPKRLRTKLRELDKEICVLLRAKTMYMERLGRAEGRRP